ncbi:UNVERIFIED_ORG: hypothetical protein M2328_006742 [Rhodococcus erythropolis]
MSSDWHICRDQAATSIAITESRWLERPLGWHQRGRPICCLRSLPRAALVSSTFTIRTADADAKD